MADAEHSSLRKSFRMLAHEAVVFALLGFFFVLTADFLLDPRHSNPAPKITVSRTMFAPDGTVRMAPEAEVRDAYQAGGADAIQVKDAKGAVRYVKPTQVDEVLAAGGSLIEESPDPFARFSGRPYLGRGDLDWILSARGFQDLSPADKRAALFKQTGDKDFASLSDAETTDFVSRFQEKQKQNKQSIVGPNGETGLIPAERLQEAFAAGYREADIFDVLLPEESADRNLIVNRKASTQREWRENGLAWIRALALHLVIGALVGFPSGLLVWGFYRIFRFAITG